jgi:ribonuclease HI
VPKSALADLLRFIAANEDLPRSLARYPGHTRDTLGKLLDAAADRIEALDAEAPASASSAGNKGLKVRKGSEVERAAARAAEELQESMELSKAEREARRRERAAAAAAAERQEQAAVAEVAALARPVHTRLYCDGAARGNPGPAGAGAVIVNPAGHIVAKVGKFLGEETNNVAEYMGLILGLKRAKAMGIKELEVLADSELVVKQVNGDYAVKAEHLQPLHAEAVALLKAFDQIEIRHIPREENGQADAMSNRAIDERL